MKCPRKNSSYFFLLLTYLVAFGLWSCFSTSSDSENSSSKNLLSEDIVDPSDAKDQADGVITTAASQSQASPEYMGLEEFENTASIKHPDRPTAWATKALILTTPQPSPTLLSSCFENLKAMNSGIGSLHQLKVAATSLSKSIQQKKKMYHWCFYQTAGALDHRLETSANLVFEQMSDFTGTMKLLLLLATALDHNQPIKVYSKYLKIRYKDLSSQYFARDVVDFQDQIINSKTTNEYGKHANPFFAH